MPVRVSEHDAGRENESYSKEVLHQYIRVKLSSQDNSDRRQHICNHTGAKHRGTAWY